MSLERHNPGALINRQWWKVCFVHGDQTKYYRQLYGKRAAIRTQIRDYQQRQLTTAAGAAGNTNNNNNANGCDYFVPGIEESDR